MTDFGILSPSGGASAEALSRYMIVGKVLGKMRRGKSRSEAIQTVAASAHLTFQGEFRKVSERTLYRWLSDYEEAKLAGLEPGKRLPEKTSRVIPEALVTFGAQQKQLDPVVSIPEILDRARQSGLIAPEAVIDRTTFYRALQRAGVPVQRRKAAACREASQRFAYAHRTQMLLCDGKHFRAGASRAKRVALFFLDDASRYGLDVIVGTSENTRLFLLGLYRVIRRYGFFSMVYLDRGPGFAALDSAKVIANLGALLILGKEAYPEAHGKIERFNQTAKGKLLRGLDRRPDVDPDCEALTLRLRHWLKDRYNHTPHESLKTSSTGHRNKLTPHERFHQDTAPLRFPESIEDLEERFVVYLKRRVSNDHIVKVDSVLYEMPRGTARAKVTLHRRVLTDTIHFVHDGRLIQLHPVDLQANAQTPRKTDGPPEAIEHPLPPSAADTHFQREMAPVVEPDGGFALPSTEQSGGKTS